MTDGRTGGCLTLLSSSCNCRGRTAGAPAQGMEYLIDNHQKHGRSSFMIMIIHHLSGGHGLESRGEWWNCATARICLRRKADGTGSEKSCRSDISRRMEPRDWTPKAGRAQSLAHQLAMVHGERCTVATPHGGFPAACGIQNCFARRACTKR